MQFTWHFWPNPKCGQLLPHGTEFYTKRFIAFSKMEPQRNSQHGIANEHQKNLAEKLLSLREANIILIKRVSFNERGIGITLTSVVSWKSVGPQIESVIRKLYRGATFNESPW